MFSNENIVILYGSQTGNAQDLAERIWRESKRFYFKASVKCMDDYNVLQLISEKCVIFVCSTTGQGEEPDNMKQFWKFLLRKSLPTDSLINLKYAVLGLGDSSYTKFNFAAKRLHKRLSQLGAQSLIPLGLGDDQHDLGYDAVADPWIESLWTNLLLIYPLPSVIKPLEKNTTILPRWSVTTNSIHNLKQPLPSIYDLTRKPSDFRVTCIENSRTTSKDHFQDVRLIKLQTEGQEYSPGDVVSLRPKNLPWQVKAFQELLVSHNLNFNVNLKLSETDPEVPVPQVLKQELPFQQLCEEYFDLMSIPRRHTFHILSQLTDSELEKEKCLEFTTAEGQDDLYSYCNRPKRNIVEVLQDFPHATKNLTKEMLFEIFPPIKPREFSIASSYRMHPNEIHILLAVVKYKTKLVKERYGLCSNYLADMKVGDEITATIKGGSFKFPKNSDIPVIMVGPGTGVAPFRNYIFERVKEGTASSENMLLFFGCRNRNSDFHCKHEFLGLEGDRKLTLIPAYSREQEQKVYVQHKIIEHKETVWKLLKSNAQVFVAGSAKLMPQEVRQAFISVCESCGNIDKNAAEKFIEKMEKQTRYQTECWS